MHTIDLVDNQASQGARRVVRALKEHWIQRAPVPFFTLGAATYLDVTAAGRREDPSARIMDLGPVALQAGGTTPL